MKELCRLCGHQLEYVFSHLLLEKYSVKYFVCHNCELLQTEKPYWLEEAYISATVSAADTGVMLRNINLCKAASVFIYFLFQKESQFIDYGGGIGLFTRLMRDVGFDFYCFDKYVDNLLARGFEAVKSKTYSAATVFEVFEHLDDPLKSIEDILSYLKNKNILFTTVLYGDHVPNPDQWWYYVFDTGQHISIYSAKSLHWIAKKYNLNLWSNGSSLHIFTEKKISDGKLKTLNRFNKILFPYVNRLMSSRIMSDHKMFLKSKSMGLG